MRIDPDLGQWRALVGSGASHLRLQTIVRLRWVAVLGQFVAVCAVWLLLGFPLPIGFCLGLIALSAWLNVFLQIRFPARTRLGAQFATVLLAYDIVQLAALLYLTGGVENPFTFLLVAPVSVSAATLPARNTVLLGVIAALAALALVYNYQPLPWYPSMRLDMPLLYKLGILVATCAGMIFLALYTFRVSDEGRQMSAALAATELVLAREQKLHALDGLAAAAAHELGTPLSTIVLVAKELEKDGELAGKYGEDLSLLRTQAERCREILKKLTRRQGEEDPLHANLTVRELIDEAVAPYRDYGIAIDVATGPAPSAAPELRPDPIGRRRPGVIYGLGNIVENAVDYARTRVDITAEWDADRVIVMVTDDGPGFPPDLMDRLGEPYVRTRLAGASKRHGAVSGLGLGFFIAKTLLERSGATVTLDNSPGPATGAVVRITWPRSAFASAPASFTGHATSRS